MHLISSSLSINDVRAFAIGVGADELGNFERGGILRTSFRHVPFLVRLSSVQTSLMDMPFKSFQGWSVNHITSHAYAPAVDVTYIVNTQVVDF